MSSRNPGEVRCSASHLLSVLLLHRRELLGENVYTRENDRHLRELISTLLWKHSEAEGKYVGCRYWSVNALRSHQNHGRVVTNASQFPTDALRHEHLVPRHQLTNLLLDLEGPTDDRVRGVLEQLNIGVVVTVAEHALLANTGDAADPWRRYRTAGVEWEDTRL